MQDVSFRALGGEFETCGAGSNKMAHGGVGQVIAPDAGLEQSVLDFRVLAGTGHMPAGAKSCVKSTNSQYVAGEGSHIRTDEFGLKDGCFFCCVYLPACGRSGQHGQ